MRTRDISQFVFVLLLFIGLYAAALAQSPTQTQTTLTASATQVAAGQPIKLTATVSAQGGSPVSRGLVSFYDGKRLLGTVTVVNSGSAFTHGTAHLATQLGPGAQSLKAAYVGNSTYQGSSSSIVDVVVGSDFPVSVQLSSSGSAGNYAVNGTVMAMGTIPPTGTLALNDTTVASTQIASATLGNSATGTEFLSVAENSGYAFWHYPAAADLNNDGILDLLLPEAGSNYIDVALGHGDGTFGTATQIDWNEVNGTGTDEPYMVAVADFNGDGLPDIAEVNNAGKSLCIGIGNGTGSFQHQGNYPVGDNPRSLVVADFNGDGVLDIAVANHGNMLPGNTGNTISVLLGNGDGTFASAVTYPVGPQPYAISVGDFNGDGIPDLAVANSDEYGQDCSSGVCPGSTLGILLGKGDGTFNAQTVYPVQMNPIALAIGDFNGDGIQDVVTVNELNSASGDSVTVLIGKGDGTFSVKDSFSLPQICGSVPGFSYCFGTGVSIVDWNSDGIPDLEITASDGNGTMGVLFIYSGKGDGTFTETAYFTGPELIGLTTGDFNGDGLADLAVVGGNFGGPWYGWVVLNGVQSTSSATFSSFLVAGSGSHTIVGAYSGDTNYLPATSQSIPLTATAAFSVTPPASGTTISAPGQSGTATLQVAALNGFAGTVNLQCSLTSTVNSGAAPTCGITPSVTLSSASTTGTATLSVNTTASSSSLQGGPELPGRRVSQVFFACLLFAFLPLRRGIWRRTLLTVAFLGLLVGTQACGGGGSGGGGGGTYVQGTPVGTYSFTVTATDSKNANDVVSTTVSITVS